MRAKDFDPVLLRTLLSQMEQAPNLSLRSFVWGRFEDGKLQELQYGDQPVRSDGEWTSLGCLEVILRRGMAWTEETTTKAPAAG